MSRHQKIALVVVAVLALLYFSPAAEVAKKVVRKLKTFGPDPDEDSNGVIPESPSSLLADVNADLAEIGHGSITLDEYSLARAIQSEHGNSEYNVQVWIAWAIRNAAGGPSKVHSKVTYSRTAASSGLYAHQNSDVGRYCASHVSPTLDTIKLAVAVLRSLAINDPTNGATNFFSPKTQDYGFKQYLAGNPRFKGYTKDANAIREAWAKGGLVSVGSPSGAAPGEVEFFRKGVA